MIYKNNREKKNDEKNGLRLNWELSQNIEFIDDFSGRIRIENKIFCLFDKQEIARRQ